MGDKKGKELYGWTGKILRVDLGGETLEEETAKYAPTFIGGRGFAAKIAWDEIPPGMTPFDPQNPLMFFTGPLTGTMAPFSGRTTVSSLSPQAYPHEWFTRGGMGGHWGPELKYAGYDGLVVKGKAERPVYLWIHDDKVKVRGADDLWGLGTYETQQRLMARHGQEVKIVTIGQAGENLSRIAIINTETEAAAGQGGFGAVMGSKNLKAVVVRGRGGVRIAKPEEFLDRCKAITEEARYPNCWSRQPKLNPQMVAKYGQKFWACTQQCTSECTLSRYYTRVPRVVGKGVHSGQLHCVSPLFRGIKGGFYNWDLGFEAGFEVSRFANDYGLNHWDILLGLIPWLRACKEAGLLKQLDELPIDLDDPHFWVALLRKMAYKEGIGEVLAEGGRRAAAHLGLGKEFSDQVYAAWGYAGHWDGHGDHVNHIVFPFWLVTGLMWAMDSRDPLSSGHGYTDLAMNWSPIRSPEEGLTWEEIMAVGEKVYGTIQATDPRSGYQAKAFPAVWHGHRSVLKDSLTIDDTLFPRIVSRTTEDHLARAGDMEGPTFEYHLFTSATGLEMSIEEFDLACERIFNLERAILVRNHGRCRETDESIIPYLERKENWGNPFLGERLSLDREKFLRLMDEYYELRGWDRESGRPTRDKLDELGLGEVADELKERGLLP